MSSTSAKSALRLAHTCRAIAAALALVALCGPAMGDLRIGFVDPGAPNEPGARNAAALAFARTQGTVVRLRPLPEGGFSAPDGRIYAPEEFDVVWYHEGEGPPAGFAEAALADLAECLRGGGAFLASGSAGALLHDMGVEPTAPRVLGPTAAPFVSGVVVPEGTRGHPIFEGLDASRPILLTSLGGNALADFYSTTGPSGTLLGDGNAGLGERPLVEYSVGLGTAIFVGWRLPDFTTSSDPYRPNLERLFANTLRYLAGRNSNHCALAAPAGGGHYMRVCGVPFLVAEHPEPLKAPAGEARTAAALQPPDVGGGGVVAHGFRVLESDPPGLDPAVPRLALTLSSRVRPAAAYLEHRATERAARQQQDEQFIGGRRVLRPTIETAPGPLRPLRLVEPERSVLVGHSPFMAPGDGLGDIAPVYEPIEDGGFRIFGSKRSLNRPIVHGQNRLWTGDVPLFRVDTPTGQGCYAEERIFPLFPRPDAQQGQAETSLGTLRLGLVGADDRLIWLDELPSTATFRPGYTRYEVTLPDGGKAEVAIAPVRDSHGFVCRVEFDREERLAGEFGGIWWQPAERNSNKIEKVTDADGREFVRITEPNLPKGMVLAALDRPAAITTADAPYGSRMEFRAAAPGRAFHFVSAWGVESCDSEQVARVLARLDTEVTAAWPEARDRLKSLWYDTYIAPALNPEERLRSLLKSPDEALQTTMRWWDARREEFQIRTPDPHLDALINWSRCTTEYHRQGPGLVLGAQIWQMYSHISTGWKGKQWGGDHQAIEECLRLYGAAQTSTGFIPWLSCALVPFTAENNTAYWVDQVWWHYAWTGDAQFLRDLFPAVRKAVQWTRATNDPDGDGLFRDSYEYWNCDSNGKGPKSVVPTAMAWAMMDRAARIAHVLEDSDAETEYRALADKTQEAALRELWREDKGRLGCIGADGIWRGHPQTWEEYLPILCGLLDESQGRRAMRWLASHYGFHPSPDVSLLACSDWYPTRWSVQWVPTGDTCLAALAGMRCGDADIWWPYLRTVVGSAFRSDCPGINMGISNTGAGGGDREDVDSVDPHVHAAVRGLFGIEPAIQEGRIDIRPAFPSEWTAASIRTPDIAYEWHREGAEAVLDIRTPKPLAKTVRMAGGDRELTTASEDYSVVRVPVPEPAPPLEPPEEPTVLRDHATSAAPAEPAPTPDELARAVLFDLRSACNVTAEEFCGQAFVYDYADGPAPIAGWWGNPPLFGKTAPRGVATPSGVPFLTSGRDGEESPPAKDLLALTGWAPHPWPAEATIPVGLRCERVWLLLQSYVHPMKNYIPNGEVVLRYAEGPEEIVSLIPPYNLDAYFQHFSLGCEPVPLGTLRTPGGWGFVPGGLCEAHADSLAVPCDPQRILQSITVRATCSEGAIGVAGLTVLPAAAETAGPQ